MGWQRVWLWDADRAIDGARWMLLQNGLNAAEMIGKLDLDMITSGRLQGMVAVESQLRMEQPLVRQSSGKRKKEGTVYI